MMYFTVAVSKEGLKKNIGFYVFIAIIIIHTINVFTFYIRDLDLLNIKIENLIYAINNLDVVKENERKKQKK